MNTKNILTIVGVVAGGFIIYKLLQGNKKQNKLEIDVKDQVANLQSQLDQAKNNITSQAIKNDPALQQTIKNLQNYRGFGINR
jgi:uncharacterized membrane-anchored protein YhcB (DUF1043 family)